MLHENFPVIKAISQLRTISEVNTYEALEFQFIEYSIETRVLVVCNFYLLPAFVRREKWLRRAKESKITLLSSGIVTNVPSDHNSANKWKIFNNSLLRCFWESAKIINTFPYLSFGRQSRISYCNLKMWPTFLGKSTSSAMDYIHYYPIVNIIIDINIYLNFKLQLSQTNKIPL